MRTDEMCHIDLAEHIRRMGDAMEKLSKFKSIKRFHHIVLPIIIISAIALSAYFFLGEVTFLVLLSTALFIMTLIYLSLLWRTKETVFLIPLLFYFFDGITLVSILLFERSPWTILFAALAGLFFILLLIALFTRKLNWRLQQFPE